MPFNPHTSCAAPSLVPPSAKVGGSLVPHLLVTHVQVPMLVQKAIASEGDCEGVTRRALAFGK